jgi:hypothetical protein
LLVAHKFDLAIEKTIKQVAQKVTYGLKQEVYANIEHNAPNIPWVKLFVQVRVFLANVFFESI